MSHFSPASLDETLLARIFAVSALVLVAAVVLGLGRPAKAEMRISHMEMTACAARCQTAHDIPQPIASHPLVHKVHP